MKFRLILSITFFLVTLSIHCSLIADELSISKITIQGNSRFSDEVIIQKLGLKPGSTFSYEKLNAKIQNILDLYFNDGYYLVTIQPPEISPLKSGKGVVINIMINEGDRLLISNIDFVGNVYFSDEKLRSALQMKIGTPFSIQRSNAVMNAIAGLYSEKGYPFCEISIDTLSIIDKEISITYRIKENDLVRIKDIVFKGNKVTKDRTFELMMNLDQNEIYDSRKIERIRRNLLQKRYIESVEILPLNNWQILVNIEEKSMNHFQSIIGLASSKDDKPIADRLTGFIDFSFLNILGTDREAQFRWNKLTSQSSEFYLSYREPFVLNQQISAQASLRRKTVDTTFVNTDFQITSFFTMRNYSKIGLLYTFCSTLLDSISTNRNAVGALAEINRLDYPINPRSGWKNTAEYTIRWKSSKSYNQLISEEAEFLIPLNFYNVLYFKGLAKFIFTKNDTLSHYDLFTFGGYESLRGFVDNQFAAAKFGIISFEYRYLLSRDSRAFAFIDYGYCKEYGNLLGVGLGVRLRSRIGIIKLDYGIGYQDGTWTNPLQGTVHFGLETGF